MFCALVQDVPETLTICCMLLYLKAINCDAVMSMCIRIYACYCKCKCLVSPSPTCLFISSVEDFRSASVIPPHCSIHPRLLPFLQLTTRFLHAILNHIIMEAHYHHRKKHRLVNQTYDIKLCRKKSQQKLNR